MQLSPDNFLFFLTLFSVSVFSGTYLLFTYYVDRLVITNALILFLCAFRVAAEFYMPTIDTFEQAESFMRWQGYGIPVNMIVGMMWICVYFHVRPLRGFRWESLCNKLFLWGFVVIPFTIHSYFMAKGNLFFYNPEKMDGYWKYSMHTDNWYFPIYDIHLKLTVFLVFIVLVVGIIRNKKKRLRQSLLMLSYVFFPIVFFTINVPSEWNVPNSGLLYVTHSLIISWYVSNYRLFKSNIGLITKDLFNSITDLAISTNEDLQITNYNQKAKEFFDSKSKNVIRLIENQISDPSIDLNEIVSSLMSLEQDEVEIVVNNKDGDSRIMKLKVAPFKNGEKLFGYTFLFSDLTEIRQQEQKLEELNNTKDTLFQIIGHDLKKPTINFRNVSKNISYLLDKQDYKRLKLLGEEVDQDAKSLYNLTDNLLNWALMQKDTLSIKPVNVNLHEIVHYNIELFSALAKRKGIRLENKVGHDEYSNVDRNSIDTIVRNLIDNALKYTEDGGLISITSTIRNGLVNLSINDTGIGMDQQLIDSLTFEKPIKSEKGTQGEKGSGIGLQLVRQLLNKNEGNLSITSVKGEGSTFTLSIPMAI